MPVRYAGGARSARSSSSSSSSSSALPVRPLLFVLVGAVAGAVLISAFLSLPNATTSNVTGPAQRRSIAAGDGDDDDPLTRPCPCNPCPVCPFTVMGLPKGANSSEISEAIATAGQLEKQGNAADLQAKPDRGQEAGVEAKQETERGARSLDIAGGTALDRMFERTISVDLQYTLNIAPSHWARVSEPQYRDAMQALHGEDIWADPRTSAMTDLLEIKTSDQNIYGSTMEIGVLKTLIQRIKPRLLVEVGVFRGSTSIKMAQLLDTMPELAESFIISIDTWLLDLRFVWSAPDKGADSDNSVGTGSRYFKNVYVGGASHMYYIFLSNVLRTRTQHRIIPLQTTSSNGAMALIAHRLRPDLIYVDASHANPDVFVDLENYYQLLAPGGALAMDDYNVLAVRTAIHALTKKHGLDLQLFSQGRQAYVFKPRDAP